MRRRSYRVEFTSRRGDVLAGIVDEAEDGSDAGELAKGPVVVFSHCFTCNKDLKAIVRISRSLADLGVTVLRFDMTGLGSSTGDFSRSSFSTNCDDLRSAIEFATREVGAVRGLIGHSFGGAASLAVAADKEFEPMATVRSLVLLAAPSDTGHLAQLLRSMNPKIESDGLGDVSIGGRNWTIRREMLLDFEQHDLPSLLPRIELPTLIFHSPSDGTVRFDHALRMMGLMNGYASLITMRGSDHLLTKHGEDWDWVSRTGAAFVHRHAAVS